MYSSSGSLLISTPTNLQFNFELRGLLAGGVLLTTFLLLTTFFLLYIFREGSSNSFDSLLVLLDMTLNILNILTL
jgi:hypothetical protein